MCIPLATSSRQIRGPKRTEVGKINLPHAEGTPPILACVHSNCCVQFIRRSILQALAGCNWVHWGACLQEVIVCSSQPTSSGAESPTETDEGIDSIPSVSHFLFRKTAKNLHLQSNWRAFKPLASVLTVYFHS